MATTTTKLLQLRPKLKPYPPPKPFCSSSSSSNLENTPPPSQPNTENTPTPTPSHKTFSFSSIANNAQNASSKYSATLEEHRKHLAQFRLWDGTAASGSTPSSPSSPPSLQQLYKNTVKNNVEYNPNGRAHDFRLIRENLSKLQGKNNENGGGKFFDLLSLSKCKESFKLRPGMENDGVKRGGVGMVIGGGSENLPKSIFGKEMAMRGKERGGGDKEGKKSEFVRMYSHAELGEKLKKLSPVKKEEKGAFSLQELKERLVKVRENDEKESKLTPDNICGELQNSLLKLKQDNEKRVQTAALLGLLGGTQSCMLKPPKEHLVEKANHMSSGEKVKLELQKVRGEFKMSDSDCGSARVQVAQLTTKIKHLSTVLHKKVSFLLNCTQLSSFCRNTCPEIPIHSTLLDIVIW
ncbi:hypothetical protein BC332_20775 [Capsicum chinense]|nr:hypothetical protein BC332_20775 [Capsicum chinense]